MRLWSNVFRPVISDKAGVRRFVISVTVFAWLVDVIGHAAAWALGFETSSDCLRDWAIGTALVLAIAIPIARTMGRAYLELHYSKKEADRLSRADPLTGLANRRAFYEVAQKLGNGALALVIVDIDRFKRINDSYGHAAGDEVIKAVATRMQRDLGSLGIVARLGGEEFAVLGDHIDPSEMRHRLQAFRERVAQEPIAVCGETLRATVSIGYASRRDFGFEALYAAADKALYLAKSAGRDRVVGHEDTVGLPEADNAARLAG